MRAVNVLLLGSILGLLSGCFSNGPKVMIETPQAEDDFVVVCSWSSHSFGLHGGKSQVKESVFVASSGEVVDCGMSIFWGWLNGANLPSIIYNGRWFKT